MRGLHTHFPPHEPYIFANLLEGPCMNALHTMHHIIGERERANLVVQWATIFYISRCNSRFSPNIRFYAANRKSLQFYAARTTVNRFNFTHFPNLPRGAFTGFNQFRFCMHIVSTTVVGEHNRKHTFNISVH